MKSLALSQFPMIYLSVTALLVFFVVFCAVLAHVTAKSRDPEFRSASRLPLEEGQRHESH